MKTIVTKVYQKDTHLTNCKMCYYDTHKVNEVVYDRYNSVYSTTERPITRKKLYHKIGRLSRGVSLEKSNEYSSFVTGVLFNDSESVRAKKFQDCNSMCYF